MSDAYLKLLNKATAEALESMQRGEQPKLDPSFEPEVCLAIGKELFSRMEFRSQADGHYSNGCPILTEE